MPADYVELHCHSGFSLLDGASNPEALIARAAALSMKAIALTDHDDLGGAVRWAEAGKEHGVAAIIGLEATVGASHLTLLAMNEEGYRNLSQLVTAARSGERGAPTVSWDRIERHAAGLFCLTGWGGAAGGRSRRSRRATCRRAGTLRAPSGRDVPGPAPAARSV